MKKLFKEQSKTLYQIAKDLKIEKRNLYRYANKKTKKIPIKDLLKIADYFNLDVGDLIKKIQEYEGD